MTIHNTTLRMEVSVSVAGHEVMKHYVIYHAHAWYDNDSDPQTTDYGSYCNRDPKQVHPDWVTTEMLYAADGAAAVEFAYLIDSGKIQEDAA